MNKETRIAIMIFMLSVVLVLALIWLNIPSAAAAPANLLLPTPTLTPPPDVNCAKIHVNYVGWSGNPVQKLYAEIHNLNLLRLKLNQVHVDWPYVPEIADLDYMAWDKVFDGAKFYHGHDFTPPTDVTLSPAWNVDANSVYSFVIKFESSVGMDHYNVNSILYMSGCHLHVNWPAH